MVQPTTAQENADREGTDQKCTVQEIQSTSNLFDSNPNATYDNYMNSLRNFIDKKIVELNKTYDRPIWSYMIGTWIDKDVKYTTQLYNATFNQLNFLDIIAKKARMSTNTKITSFLKEDLDKQYNQLEQKYIESIFTTTLPTTLSELEQELGQDLQKNGFWSYLKNLFVTDKYNKYNKYKWVRIEKIDENLKTSMTNLIKQQNPNNKKKLFKITEENIQKLKTHDEDFVKIDDIDNRIRYYKQINPDWQINKDQIIKIIKLYNNFVRGKYDDIFNIFENLKTGSPHIIYIKHRVSIKSVGEQGRIKETMYKIYVAYLVKFYSTYYPQVEKVEDSKTIEQPTQDVILKVIPIEQPTPDVLKDVILNLTITIVNITNNKNLDQDSIVTSPGVPVINIVAGTIFIVLSGIAYSIASPIIILMLAPRVICTALTNDDAEKKWIMSGERQKVRDGEGVCWKKLIGD